MKLFNVYGGLVPFVDLASRTKRLPKSNKGQYFMKIGKITLRMGLRSVEALRL
jgi:hypothetical protein